MRRVLLPLLLALVLAAAALWWSSRPLPILTVITWPGAYGRAQASAQMHPFGAAAHVDVRPAQYDGGLDELARAVATKTYAGDVIDMELPDAVKACRQGLLEHIDPATLPAAADGTPASRDFVAGALGPCWVGEVLYAQVIVAAPDSGAKTLADFFDLAKFPGRRALRRGAKYNLEMALLADGVAPGDVYSTLSSEAGLARAFAKLDSIRAAVIWLDRPGDGLAMVQDGRVVMASALNGDVFAVQGQAPQARLDAGGDRLEGRVRDRTGRVRRAPEQRDDLVPGRPHGGDEAADGQVHVPRGLEDRVPLGQARPGVGLFESFQPRDVRGEGIGLVQEAEHADPGHGECPVV